MEPKPEGRVHVPTPTLAALPVKVMVSEQTLWSRPALAMVGATSRKITTVSLDEPQTPLVIVHTKVTL